MPFYKQVCSSHLFDKFSTLNPPSETQMNTKRKSKKNATPKTPKVRDLPTKKDAKGGFGGPVIGPSGRGG
jgi:hypothetical protein